MKRWLAIGVTATFSLALNAQEKPATPAPKPEIEIQSPLAPKAATSASTNIMEAIKDPLVKYSGLATDLKRSTNRWKMFSLRKPTDPKSDQATLIRDTRTEAGGPIKLFSIDF
jgi:hypothetical protein